MKHSIYYCYASVEPHQRPRHYLFFFNTNFSVIVFNIFFLIFTLLQPFSLPYLFICSLLLQPFSLSYIFISPLPSKLISFFLFPFIFLYFCFFLFTSSYYKFVTISFILCIVFPHNKKVLSLSLSLKFLVDFFFLAYLLKVDNFLYPLKLYFGLMRFSFFFKLFLFFCFCFCSLWLLNVILLRYKELNIAYKNIILFYLL